MSASRTIVILGCLLCWLPAVPSVAEEEAESSHRIRVGVLLPLSGAEAELGQGLLMGIEFAARSAPAHVRPVYQDVVCDAALAKSAAERMHRDEHVDVFLGPVCPEAIATVLEFAEKERVPVISLLHASLQVASSQQSYAFAYDWRQERALIVGHLKEQEYQKIVLFGVRESSHDLLLRKQIADAGIAVRMIALDEDSLREFPRTLREVVASSPDLLVLSSAAQQRFSSLGAQLSRLPIPLLLQGGMHVSPAAERGTRYTRPALDPGDREVQGLAEHVQKYFRADSSSLALAFLGYEAFDYLAQSMRNSIDVHEALRLSKYRQSTALELKRFAQGRVFLVQPELVGTDAALP